MGLVVLAVALGFAAARSPNVAVLMIGVVLTPLAARARPPGLVLLAFGAAWIGPTTTAWLEFPRVFDFASIPLIALAFTVALYEYRRVPRPSTSISSAVAWLPFMAFALSALIHGTHPTRYVASTVLYLLPFLAIVALTRVELSVRQRRTVITTVTLVLIGQVPFALVQAAQSSNADDVKGTLLGTGAGHHVLGSVALVGSLALPALWRTPNPVLLGSVFVGFFIAWLSDSLIPLFIVPPLIPLVALLKLPPKPDPAWRRVRAQVLVMSLIVAGVFGFVVDSGGLGGGTQVKITNTLNPDRGKQAVARLLVVDLTERPVSVLFGLGPAETVSRLSQLTTPSGSKEGSPVQALGLAPSQHYDEYRIAARIPAGQGSSLTSATSSTLGLLGDFGIVGVLCYGWAFLHVARRVWRLGTVLGAVALVGWIAMLLLGGAYDWLEQPPYTLTAAIVVGLALTDPAVRDRRGPR
ncbi:MAG TPA: hypothetical protein VFW06_05045, partial [Acidimicrobiia bacterium]|nr:hypothetical protein [Acidimicrobiia bacterium]